MAGIPTNDPARFKGPVGPLQHRCALCLATDSHLQLCGGCRAVRYCSRDHQVAHRQQHKSACTGIKKARAQLAEEEDLVRNATPDFTTPANAFETHVGRFWGILSTRDYMRARLRLASKHLLRLGTLDGVQEALDHFLDMMRLNRSDNIGLRFMTPAIMLRLDLDQECYDFVKWWATLRSSSMVFDDMTMPYLDIRGADALEAPSLLLDGDYSALHNVVAILLLKLKLLVDINSLKMTRKVLSGSRLPPELFSQIETDVIRSPLSAKLQKLSPSSLLKVEIELLSQTRQLGAAVVQANEYFVFHLLDPDDALQSCPESSSMGSLEETSLALQYSYPAWWETQGVLRLLRDARACAARDSESEISDMMQSDVFRSSAGSDRTAEELLEDVSVNRIWGYLDWAMEDASFLGPLSERPSVRHIRENKALWERMDSEDGDSDDCLERAAWDSDGSH